MTLAPTRVPVVVALLLALRVGPASAAPGVPVTLPPGESVTRWEHALALGGLVAGPTGSSQTIILSDLGGQWLIRARGADGRWREASIRVPRSELEREGVVWLAKSLLTSSDVGAGWGDLSAPGFVVDAAAPSPEPAVPPRRPKPAPSAEPPIPLPPPAPAAPVMPTFPEPPPPAEGGKSPLPPSPAPAPPRRPARPVGPPRPPRHTAAPSPAAPFLAAPWVNVGGALDLRPGATAGGSLHVAAGLRLIRRLDLGVSLDISPMTPLLALAGDRALAQTDLDLTLGLAFPGSSHPVATLHGGAGLRTFFEDTTEVAQGWTPTLGARFGLDLPLVAPLSVNPWVDARLDLRPTELHVGTESSSLEPVAVRLGLTFTVRRNLADSPPSIEAR